MTDFLLEIFSEETPAMLQKVAAENFTKIATEILFKNNLQFEKTQLRSFVTPRRLTLYIHNLSTSQISPAIKRIGPKIDADLKAIDGFLRSVGTKDISSLQIVENNGYKCYADIKPESEIQTTKILQNSLPQILQKMVGAWPKLMRWDVEEDGEQPLWIRPIRNISCIFGDQIIDIKFAGLRSNNFTFGHNSKNHEALKIDNAKHYQELLDNNFAILSHEERKNKIIHQIRKIEHESGLETIDDKEKSTIFDEIAGLCEWPTALLASIDKKFMDLPKEVLTLTLKLNQKYLCLKSLNTNADKFILVADVACHTDEFDWKKIISDNEKLVLARLNDAQFFITEDLKRPLISRLDDLKKIIFHNALGSVYDKIARLQNLAKFLAVFVPHCDLSLVERTVDLAKVDLVTKTVAELPELQGKIGSFYAKKQGENDKVAIAIYEHYLPLGPTSELPKTSLGITLSIADKIDSVVGFFLANEKPTSSKDPYGLRRAALGVIRISIQYDITFPIRILVEKSLNAYPTKLIKQLLTKENENDFYESKKLLVQDIVKFFVERLKTYLGETEMVKADVINAVIDEYLANLDIHKYCDILYLVKKIRFLNEFITDQNHKNILALYKRTINILTIEEKNDEKRYEGRPSLLSLKSKYEKVLYRRIKQISKEFKKLVAKGEFALAFKLFDVIEAPLSHFFDHVMVNDPNKNIRENRLLLLSKIRKMFNLVADLSKIEK